MGSAPQACLPPEQPRASSAALGAHEFCSTPHWACAGALQGLSPLALPPSPPAHQKPPLLSLPFWSVASIIGLLACWPASVCQGLLLQPAGLQVSSWGGEKGGRDRAWCLGW